MQIVEISFSGGFHLPMPVRSHINPDFYEEDMERIERSVREFIAALQCYVIREFKVFPEIDWHLDTIDGMIV